MPADGTPPPAPALAVSRFDLSDTGDLLQLVLAAEAPTADPAAAAVAREARAYWSRVVVPRLRAALAAHDEGDAALAAHKRLKAKRREVAGREDQAQGRLAERER